MPRELVQCSAPDELIPLGRVHQRILSQPARASVYRWAKQGVGGRKLPTCKIGGRFFVFASQLAEFVSTN